MQIYLPANLKKMDKSQDLQVQFSEVAARVIRTELCTLLLMAEA